jgi:transposase
VVENPTAFADQPAWTRAKGRPTDFEWHHVRAARWLPLEGLPERVRSAQDHLQSLRALERARHLAGDICGGRRQSRHARAGGARQQSRENPSLRKRRKRGAETQAIGVTKGGRNSKIHAVVDEECRPWVFVLTPGNTADCIVAETCVSLIPGIAQLVADKGYDTDAFRAWLKKRRIATVIPGKSNRKKRIRYDKEAYKGRNVVERCFCRLKDWRRIATRYDKLARNYLSALCLAAMVAYWL